MQLQFSKKIDGKGRTSYNARSNGWLFVLTHRADKNVMDLVNNAVEQNKPLECMITGPLGSHPQGLVVDVVTHDYELVAHTGFECAGSMCSTQAYAPPTPGQAYSGSLTPGRCQDILPIAHNVNAAFDKRDPHPKTPGAVYVRSGERRAAGIPDLGGVDPKAHASLVRHAKRMAELRAAA